MLRHSVFWFKGTPVFVLFRVLQLSVFRLEEKPKRPHPSVCGPLCLDTHPIASLLYMKTTETRRQWVLKLEALGQFGDPAISSRLVKFEKPPPKNGGQGQCWPWKGKRSSEIQLGIFVVDLFWGSIVFSRLGQ